MRAGERRSEGRRSILKSRVNQLKLKQESTCQFVSKEILLESHSEFQRKIKNRIEKLEEGEVEQRKSLGKFQKSLEGDEEDSKRVVESTWIEIKNKLQNVRDFQIFRINEVKSYLKSILGE